MGWKILFKITCCVLISLFVRKTLWSHAEGKTQNVFADSGLIQGRLNDGASDETSKHFNERVADTKDTQKWKHVYASNSKEVLINTYMRSGSSFLGRVLGFRSDTFYVYEPLWGLVRDEYFSSDDQKCGTFRPYCKKSTEVNTAFQALHQLYNCTFYTEQMLKLLRQNVVVKLSGNRWDVFKDCKLKGHTGVTCLTAMANEVCASSKYKVTKVLRISLGNTEVFLQSRPNLKVVHLFRDPRAMINSHTRTRWSPIRKSSLGSIEAGAKSICLRIEKDIKYAEELKKKYPDRFIILQYEDFTDSLPKIRKMLKFLEINFSNEVLNFIDNSDKTNSNKSKHGNHPFMYREQLDWRAVEIINRHCFNVFQLLGYTMFNSERTFRNLSVSAVTSLPFALL